MVLGFHDKKKVFEKKNRNFFAKQKREQKAPHTEHTKRKERPPRFALLCFALLCARIAFGVPCKTLRKVGEKRLSALTLSFFLFFSCEKSSTSSRGEHCEKSAHHHQNTVISSHHAERTFITQKSK